MLSDAQKRAAYDQHGHAGVDPNMGGFRGPGSGRLWRLRRGLRRHLWRHLRGRRRWPAWRRWPAGLPWQRPVLRHGDHLEEAARGKETQIRIPSWEHCETCSGTGAKPGTTAKACGSCGGSGQVHMRQGFFSIQQTCPHCHGTGKIIPDPCMACNGQGKVKKKTLEVKIPAGINEGMRIRSAGNGEPGVNGGPPGISTSRSASSSTTSSSATATTCTAPCPCRW